MIRLGAMWQRTRLAEVEYRLYSSYIPRTKLTILAFQNKQARFPAMPIDRCQYHLSCHRFEAPPVWPIPDVTGDF